MSGRVGCLGHSRQGGDMVDGEALPEQGDEGTAQLARGVVVVLPCFQAIGPADALPQHRGVIGMAMTHENTVDTRFMELIHEVLGSAETADGLPFTAEVAVPCGGGDSDDVLFMLVRGLVALLHGGLMELEAGNMEAEEGGGGDAAIHLGQAVGGGIKPLILVCRKPRASADRGIGGTHTGSRIHHVEGAAGDAVSGDEHRVVTVARGASLFEEAVGGGLKPSVLPVDSLAGFVIVVAVDGCPGDTEAVHEVTEQVEAPPAVVELAVDHVPRDEDEVGVSLGDNAFDLVGALDGDGLGLPQSDLPLVEAVRGSLLGGVDDLHIRQLEDTDGTVGGEVKNEIRDARIGSGDGGGFSVEGGHGRILSHESGISARTP